MADGSPIRSDFQPGHGRRSTMSIAIVSPGARPLDHLDSNDLTP
jgi:hypothetical protein